MPVGGLDRGLDTRQLHRMEDAPADPVPEEALARHAIHRRGDDAVGGARDRSLPFEIDVVADVLRDEAHREPVVVPIQLIAEEPGLDRVPVAVADRGVEAEHDRVVAQLHVAQVAALQDRRQRPGAQVVPLRQRLVLAILAHRRRKHDRFSSVTHPCHSWLQTQETFLAAALGSITSASPDARSSVACSRPAAERMCASMASSAARASRARTASKMGTCSA